MADQTKNLPEPASTYVVETDGSRLSAASGRVSYVVQELGISETAGDRPVVASGVVLALLGMVGAIGGGVGLWTWQTFLVYAGFTGTGWLLASLGPALGRFLGRGTVRSIELPGVKLEMELEKVKTELAANEAKLAALNQQVTNVTLNLLPGSQGEVLKAAIKLGQVSAAPGVADLPAEKTLSSPDAASGTTALLAKKREIYSPTPFFSKSLK